MSIEKGGQSFGHPSTFAQLGEDVWVANPVVAVLEITTTPKSQKSITSGRGCEGNAGSPRQLVVIRNSVE